MSLNKYDKEVQRETKERDSLILAEITAIYGVIRDKSFLLSAKAKSKAGDNTKWFNTGSRKKDFAKKVNDTLKDEYIKRDVFTKNVYAEEYRTSYFYANYATENLGLSKGYNVNLSRYTKDQFKEALNYSMSVIMDTQEMTMRRKQATKQIYKTILNGVETGLSQEKINRNIEIDLGYRDSQGKYIPSKKKMRGQAYKTKRLIRTEVNRIRNDASRDQWLNEQDIVKSKYMAVETLDSRTRRQSIIMDGDYSNAKGEFKYPNGAGWHFLGRSGIAKYDVNDRGQAVSMDQEFPPESRIQRDPKTGKNSIQPYTNALDWVKAKGLRKNVYGEILYT